MDHKQKKNKILDTSSQNDRVRREYGHRATALPNSSVKIVWASDQDASWAPRFEVFFWNVLLGGDPGEGPELSDCIDGLIEFLSSEIISLKNKTSGQTKL
ncbi:hypothetical protein ILYODFUR_027804 [Ilyodon furcidens]|uniref:Uncharacterized protein n=1 Tax=Ilyodon furcidens TaxID=33524 RepID=A0ABV0TML6_9TELE